MSTRAMMLSKVLKLSIFLNFSVLLVFQVSFVAARVEANETKLIFYYGPEFTDSQSYELTEAAEILKNPHFHQNQETHIYLHGWTESQNSTSTHTIVDAYLKRRDLNLITVDWAKAADVGYFEAAAVNIELIAPVLADSILDLYYAGIDRKDLRVVGHSLGGQLTGMTGRNVLKNSNNIIQIYRIDLLDPAWPLFMPGSIPSVNKSDAEFVQVIHTESGTFSPPLPLGHVDFYPNGGSNQPGCTNGTLFYSPNSSQGSCSHHRSWHFWAESVENVNGTDPKFLALPLISWPDTGPIEMGINCPINVEGSYFLTTNSEYPFAKGEDGLASF
ncbi:pancreatic lipase-related protein 2-like [Episyrphus balteatus]|uniref:pancreatic lipase-related protein 2-like n=1 Tax=Episyrphus balteatus TaxID=286459 RepID=UPI0024864433|nr:pancreatic lipase-related protein 2-like [Episyrphus balteatus]